MFLAALRLASRKAFSVMVVSLLVGASSIVYSYKEGDEREGASSSTFSGVLVNTTDMLRELFERSPGSRQSVLLATKRLIDGRPQLSGQGERFQQEPPLQQRALGKIFDAEPVVPYFDEDSDREPFVLSPVLGNPAIDYAPRSSWYPDSNPIRNYDSSPPVYLLPIGSGSGVTTPPVTAPVPEPATWGMLLLGLFVCGAVLRRRRDTPAHMELDA